MVALLELRDLLHDHLRPRRAASRPTRRRGTSAARSPSHGAGRSSFLLILPIAFSMAEVAAAYPTAGGPYWWANGLGGPIWSWFTGWFNLLGLVAIVASVDWFCAQFFTFVFNLWGLDFILNFADSVSLGEIFIVFMVILALHAMLGLRGALAGVRGRAASADGVLPGAELVPAPVLVPVLPTFRAERSARGHDDARPRSGRQPAPGDDGRERPAAGVGAGGAPAPGAGDQGRQRPVLRDPAGRIGPVHALVEHDDDDELVLVDRSADRSTRVNGAVVDRRSCAPVRVSRSGSGYLPSDGRSTPITAAPSAGGSAASSGTNARSPAAIVSNTFRKGLRELRTTHLHRPGPGRGIDRLRRGRGSARPWSRTAARSAR